MASPVDTSVVWFDAIAMPNAPQSQPNPGSLVAILDAFLVNGFDTQAATNITVAALKSWCK